MSDLAGLIEDRQRLAVKRILDAKDALAATGSRSDADRLGRTVKHEVGELARLAITLISSVDDGVRLNQLWIEQIARQLGVELPEEAPVS